MTTATDRDKFLAWCVKEQPYLMHNTGHQAAAWLGWQGARLAMRRGVGSRNPPTS